MMLYTILKKKLSFDMYSDAGNALQIRPSKMVLGRSFVCWGVKAVWLLTNHEPV